jgi:hypothetical protein
MLDQDGILVGGSNNGTGIVRGKSVCRRFKDHPAAALAAWRQLCAA